MNPTKVFVGNEEIELMAVGFPSGGICYLPAAEAAQYAAMARSGRLGGNGNYGGGGGQSMDLGKVVRLFADGTQVMIDLKTRQDIHELRKDAKAEQAKIDALQDKLKSSLANIPGGQEAANVLVDIFEATKEREYAERKALARLATASGVGALTAGGRLLSNLLPGGTQGGGYDSGFGNSGGALVAGVAGAVALNEVWKEPKDSDDEDY